MLNKNEQKFYYRLKQAGELPSSQVGKSIYRSDLFEQFLHSNVLQLQRKGRGKVIRIQKESSYDKFLAAECPKGKPPTDKYKPNAIKSNAFFRSSKTDRGKCEDPIVFFKGSQPVEINGQTVDLAYYTQHFGAFAAKVDSLSVEKLCFVENKDVFLRAHEVISSDYTFIHPYGRISGRFLDKKIALKEMFVFPDYDLVGLDEYLTCQEKFPQTRLYMPDNYDTLFQARSTQLKHSKQKPTARVLSSKDPLVVKIREQVTSTSRFLEQQALLHHAS